MNYFTDLIAKSYLNYLNNNDIDLSLLYHNEFLKVSPRVKSEINFSKGHFFKKLVSKIGFLIDGCYTEYSVPDFDPSIMDYGSYEDELEKREEIIIEEIELELYDDDEFRHLKPIPVDWEECQNANQLTYALKYKGISLKDPIIIIKATDKPKIVLRKSKLEFLKLEVEKASVSTISDGNDYLFDDSTYLKHIAEKTDQDKPVLNLTDNNVIDDVNSESTHILRVKMASISREMESFNTKEPHSEFLTSKEAADFLNLSINTIYSKTSKNEIPHMKKGKQLIFSRVELIDYAKSGKVRTRAEIENDVDNFIPKSKRK